MNPNALELLQSCTKPSSLSLLRHCPRHVAPSEIIHWNGKVFILMKCSSLAALEVVKMTTSSAASDENFVKMTTFLFQCTLPLKHLWSPHARPRSYVRFLPVKSDSMLIDIPGTRPSHNTKYRPILKGPLIQSVCSIKHFLSEDFTFELYDCFGSHDDICHQANHVHNETYFFLKRPSIQINIFCLENLHSSDVKYRKSYRWHCLAYSPGTLYL